MTPDQQLNRIHTHALNAFYELDKCARISLEMVDKKQLTEPQVLKIDTAVNNATTFTVELLGYLRGLPVPFIPEEETNA